MKPAFRSPDDLAQFGRVIPDDPPQPKPKDRFTVEQFDQIQMGEEPEWLVDGIIPLKGCGALVGESGSAKTFLASDLSFCTARNAPWTGRSVNAGAVVYITAEGVTGFRKRVAAYRERHGIKGPVPFYLISEALDLGTREGDADLLVRRIKAQISEPIRLVVFDTVARVMAGADENSTKDMMTFVANVEHIGRELDCFALALHHLGKDATKGGRGSSALKAAFDLEVFIEGQEGIRTATVKKLKDGEAGQTLRFELERVELQRHDTLTSSCVVNIVQEWKHGEVVQRRRQLKGHPKHLYDVIRNALVEFGEASPGGEDMPGGIRIVSRGKVRSEAVASQFAGADCAQNAFRSTFSRALSSLTGDGVIGQRNEWIWIVE